MSHKLYLNQRTAAACIAYQFSDIIEFDNSFFADAKAELGRRVALNEVNLFGQTTKIFDCEGTENILGVMFGAMKAGAVASGFLKDTGMLHVSKLINRYAKQNLPAVFYIATDDANVCEYDFSPETAVFFPETVQEVIDFSVLAHLTVGKSYKPAVVCLCNRQDAAYQQMVELPDHEALNKLFDVVAFCGTRARGLERGISCDIEVPILLNADLGEIVSYYLTQIKEHFGRTYHAIDYIGDLNAEKVYVSFGTQTSLIEAAVKSIADSGQHLGILKVKVLTPLQPQCIEKLIPKSAKKVLLVGYTSQCKEGCFVKLLRTATTGLVLVEDIYALGVHAYTADYVRRACIGFDTKVEPQENKYWVGCLDSTDYANHVKTILDLGENRWVVANSMALDNVEFGTGMLAGWNQRREWILNEMLFLADNTVIPSVSQKGYAYLDVKDDVANCDNALEILLDDHVREDTHCSTCTNIRASIELLRKKYYWIYAGDSRDTFLNWKAIKKALATGQNINLFVIEDRAIYKKAAEHTGNRDIFFACNQAEGVCAKTITLDMSSEQIQKILHQAESYSGPSIVVLFA